MIYPRRDWKIDEEKAILFLERTLRVLHYKSGKDYIVDPIIAEDVGGLKILEMEIKKIERCIEYIEKEKHRKAINLILEISSFWLHHALRRFIECYEGDIQPLEGVSTIDKLREVVP